MGNIFFKNPASIGKATSSGILRPNGILGRNHTSSCELLKHFDKLKILFKNNDVENWLPLWLNIVRCSRIL